MASQEMASRTIMASLSYGCGTLHLGFALRRELFAPLFVALVAIAAAIGSGGGVDSGNGNAHCLGHDFRFVTDSLVCDLQL